MTDNRDPPDTADDAELEEFLAAAKDAITPDGYMVFVRDPVPPATRLSSGVMFPKWAEFSALPIAASATAPFLLFRLDVENGGPVMTRLEIRRRDPGAPAIGSQQLRSINIEDLIKAAIANAVLHLYVEELWNSPGHDLGPDGEPRPLTDAEKAELRRVAERADLSRRRRTITDKLLAEVADIYKANEGAGTMAVHEQMATSHRNATRWVSLARERGFLPPYQKED